MHTNSRFAISKVIDLIVRLKIGEITLGCVLVALASIFYYVFGFAWIMFFMWLAGVTVCGRYFFAKGEPFFEEFDHFDGWIGGALLAVSLPVFLCNIYNVPFQVSRDETVLIAFEQNWVKEGIVDLFGVSPYFGFPYLPYLLLGWAGQLLGDINLYHQRLLHGIDGALIVACAFYFYRVVGMSKILSGLGSLFICSNHAFVAISRMAFKDNGALLLELLSLTFLFGGFTHRRFLLTYIGGLFAGISCYVYYPARITIPIWLLFLLIVSLVQVKLRESLKLRKQFAVFILGLTLALAPLGAACLKDPDKVGSGNQFLKTTSNLFLEGRALTKYHTGAKSDLEGLIRNAYGGIFVFNNNVSDHGYQYVNEPFGFVDPISGLLVWCGLSWILIFRRGQPSAILAISAFALQLFVFGFVVSKAPDYTRLLVILPFAGYFVAHGIDFIALSVGSRLQSKRAASMMRYAVIASLFLSVVIFNVVIFSRYALAGLQHGQDNGGTARYLEARKSQTNHLFVVAATPEFPYYTWNAPGAWMERMTPFIGPGQSVEIFSPEDLITNRLAPPFTLFMDGDLWKLKGPELQTIYPKLIVHKIADKRGLVALEEPTDVARSRSSYRAWNNRLEEFDQALCQGQNDVVISGCLAALNSDEVRSKGSLFKASILFDLGRAYANSSEFKKALPPLREALELRLKLMGWHNRETVAYIDSLGDVYMQQGDRNLAVVTYEKGLKILRSFAVEDLYTSHSKDLSGQAKKVADALLKAGRNTEAQQILSEFSLLERSEQTPALSAPEN